MGHTPFTKLRFFWTYPYYISRCSPSNAVQPKNKAPAPLQKMTLPSTKTWSPLLRNDSQKKIQMSKTLINICVSFHFINYLPTPWPTLGHYWGGSFIHLFLITTFFINVWCDGHHEPHNKPLFPHAPSCVDSTHTHTHTHTHQILKI